MGKREDRLARRLEARIAGVQRRLSRDDDQGRHWGGFLGGLALGTLAGALLTLLFTSRGEEEAVEALPERDDAILLRERPQPPGEQGATPPPAATDADAATDQVAAAELEGARALTEIARQAEADTPASSGRVAPVDGVCPETHPIKGNHSSSGDYIYHVPGSRNYSRTNPESCFATEADAEAAGYRAPRG